MFLALAFGVHVAVLALMPPVRTNGSSQPKDDLAWLEELHENDPVAAGHAQAFSMLTTTMGSRRSSAVSPTTKTEPPTGTESGTGTEKGTEKESESASGLPSLLITQDIGLRGGGSYRMEMARQQPSEREIQNDNANHTIMDPIRAHEALNGDLTSGPVVAELEHTTRSLAGSPFEGRAIFAVHVDELGLVLSVGVDETSGDRREWEAVAAHVLNALAQKRLVMPHGAKGMAMRIEVTSKVVLPSGSRAPLHVGSPAVDAVSKMAKGDFEKAGDTPAIIGGSFDLSDIGAHPMRVAAAHVVSETVQ